MFTVIQKNSFLATELDVALDTLRIWLSRSFSFASHTQRRILINTADMACTTQTMMLDV